MQEIFFEYYFNFISAIVAQACHSKVKIFMLHYKIVRI
jgi:hypothetical protein